MEPDYENPLHCWLTAMCRAQDQRRSLKEVVEMDAQLSNFAAGSPEFRQYMRRTDLATTDQQTRNAYFSWMHEQRLFNEENYRLRNEGIDIGMEKGKKEMVMILLRKGHTQEAVADMLEIPIRQIHAWSLSE